MEFKHPEIEVVNDNKIIVWVKEHKIEFNLKDGQLKTDLEGMGLVSTDEEFEAYLIRAANEYVTKGLHNLKRKEWVYGQATKGGAELDF